MKILMVFDFDHTVVDENCDIWVIKCLPKQTLPDSVESTYRRGQWTEYMGRVMAYIGDQGVAPDRVRSVMETIPFTPGMPELFTFISENKSTVDCIIVSDANTMFIEWVLQGAGLWEAVNQVYSNPASINESGYMELRHHHLHECAKCPVNMCKKKVLETYLSEKADGGEVYGRVFYVGDGGNDLCPAFCLSAGDAVMPRKGYTLDKMLTRLRDQEGNGSVSAKVIPWSSATDILQELKDSLQSQ
ncbi:pyridoxal phosphate phosphatase PHOSPHO2 [Poecilia reticulata]|uniref:Phosphatase, orphan 2 n=1 Tax=Poecilia reticulata TaxID=8081 RepID=A0A3P9N5F2_POERE|nr:PREDICTED: probable phosphatase phospho2 [Poecilia reticulata]XP_008403105.1 PREDICTED: probable phosphatase phospho2 [Poecilia reticulata]